MMHISSDWLIEEFVTRKSKNHRYSERAFAKAVGLSPGFLKLLFQGKRALSVSKAREVANRLGWSEMETLEFLRFLKQEKSLRKKENNKSASTVAEFFEISDWYHFAIVEILKTKERPEKSEIAKRLGISIAEVDFSMRVLAQYGLIKLKGEHSEAVENYIVPATSSSAIRKFHSQMLNKAAAAIESQPMANRDNRSLTLAFDPDQMQEASAMIKQFMGKFERRFGKGNLSRVYQLSLAFFNLETMEKL